MQGPGRTCLQGQGRRLRLDRADKDRRQDRQARQTILPQDRRHRQEKGRHSGEQHDQGFRANAANGTCQGFCSNPATSTCREEVRPRRLLRTGHLFRGRDQGRDRNNFCRGLFCVRASHYTGSSAVTCRTVGGSAAAMTNRMRLNRAGTMLRRPSLPASAAGQSVRRHDRPRCDSWKMPSRPHM